MVSRIKKILCNPFVCYSPIFIFALLFSNQLLKSSPTECVTNSLDESCLFFHNNIYLIHHPLNLINLLFLIYNLLYLYYNIILKKDVVGKSVKKIYRQTKKKYYIKTTRKRISILLFCYVTALVISYFRFSIILLKAIY